MREYAHIGEECTIGKGAYIDTQVYIGSRVKIQNHASIFGRRRARPLAHHMSSRQSLSSLFPHFLLLSLKRKSCAGKMECLEKGVHGLGGSVIQRLGSLALCNSGDNRAQWPLSRWAHPSFLSRSRHTGPLLVTVEPGL